MAEFMQTDLRDEKGILLDGSRLADMMKKAGFVDLTERKIKIEIGPWGSGLSRSYCVINFSDPQKHDIAATCADVWTAAMYAFGAQLIPKHYPDQGDAAAFKASISAELHNPDYQLFCNMCNPFQFKLTFLQVSCDGTEAIGLHLSH